MIVSNFPDTERLQLRTLKLSDVSEDYLAWMQDPEVNRFLENRFKDTIDLSEIAEFVSTINNSNHSILFGIFRKNDGKHIGNMKLGPIETEHARSVIGYLIGDRESWGKGYASEAISAVVRFGFRELGLAKITAGCYETNIGSAKALSKAGFTHEATIPSHCICEGERIASWYFGINS